MTDKEFLDYCETHCRTERAGFVPKNIARLLRLAGHTRMAKRWDKLPVRIYSIFSGEMDPLVKAARQRMETKP